MIAETVDQYALAGDRHGLKPPLVVCHYECLLLMER